MQTEKKPPHLFSYRPFWAKRFGTAEFLPMSHEEMSNLGWDSCDIIIVTGDAYIDHPSFGMALIGRLLEAQGFRVGIISQPTWQNIADFQTLGKPNLFFGITAGNMDSMVNHYTADRKIRSDDAYSPNNQAGKRPNYASIVYAQRCHEAYPDVPIVLGGIEASLRRFAHYDYWADKVKRSILFDAKADILLYGNAERAIVELSHRLANREAITSITDLRGSAIISKELPAGYKVIDASKLNQEEDKEAQLICLPSYSQVHDDRFLYAEASRWQYLESNPYNARILAQKHSDRFLLVNPPPFPLTTNELDRVYALPFSRHPHPHYNNSPIPAYDMIKFSVNIMRGCFGGCTFCSLTAHEGRIVQSRSAESILEEIIKVSEQSSDFTGIISDLGGPTANMYEQKCQNSKSLENCRKFSCVYPKICPNLSTDHNKLINLYRKARALNKIKRILIGSGLRYDLAIKSPAYIKELALHHVGGYLKIAPEHICSEPLSYMLKPEIASYQKFSELFFKYSKEAKKEQYLIPYFIAAHPGTTDKDMLTLALWLKQNNFRLDQVQNFIPTPMTLATTMYYSGLNPLENISRVSKTVFVPKKGKTRKLHKAFLRYHDRNNWPLLRQALRQMGREDLIGNAKYQLVPWR